MKNFQFVIALTAILGDTVIPLTTLNEPFPSALNEGVQLAETLTGKAPDVKATAELDGADIDLAASLNAGAAISIPLGTHAVTLPSTWAGPLEYAEKVMNAKPELVVDVTVQEIVTPPAAAAA